MSNEIRGSATQRKRFSPEAELRRQKQSTLGSFLMILGVLLLLLNAAEISGGGLPGMPRFWATNRTLWWCFALAAFFSGTSLLSGASLEEEERPRIGWRPTLPGKRFRQVVLYTREQCGLCEEAAEILRDYAPWLPSIQEVNIDDDPLLREKFDQTVPVVACDNKLRFRGRISEILLRRLIEATPPD